MVEPLHSIQSSGAVAFNQSSRAESGAVAGCIQSISQVDSARRFMARAIHCQFIYGYGAYDSFYFEF